MAGCFRPSGLRFSTHDDNFGLRVVCAVFRCRSCVGSWSTVRAGLEASLLLVVRKQVRSAELLGTEVLGSTTTTAAHIDTVCFSFDLFDPDSDAEDGDFEPTAESFDLHKAVFGSEVLSGVCVEVLQCITTSVKDAAPQVVRSSSLPDSLYALSTSTDLGRDHSSTLLEAVRAFANLVESDCETQKTNGGGGGGQCCGGGAISSQTLSEMLHIPSAVATQLAVDINLCLVAISQNQPSKQMQLAYTSAMSAHSPLTLGKCVVFCFGPLLALAIPVSQSTTSELAFTSRTHESLTNLLKASAETKSLAQSIQIFRNASFNMPASSPTHDPQQPGSPNVSHRNSPSPPRSRPASPGNSRPSTPPRTTPRVTQPSSPLSGAHQHHARTRQRSNSATPAQIHDPTRNPRVADLQLRSSSRSPSWARRDNGLRAGVSLSEDDNEVNDNSCDDDGDCEVSRTVSLPVDNTTMTQKMQRNHTANAFTSFSGPVGLGGRAQTNSGCSIECHPRVLNKVTSQALQISVHGRGPCSCVLRVSDSFGDVLEFSAAQLQMTPNQDHFVVGPVNVSSLADGVLNVQLKLGITGDSGPCTKHSTVTKFVDAPWIDSVKCYPPVLTSATTTAKVTALINRIASNKGELHCVFHIIDNDGRMVVCNGRMCEHVEHLIDAGVDSHPKAGGQSPPAIEGELYCSDAMNVSRLRDGKLRICVAVTDPHDNEAQSLPIFVEKQTTTPIKVQVSARMVNSRNSQHQSIQFAAQIQSPTILFLQGAVLQYSVLVQSTGHKISGTTKVLQTVPSKMFDRSRKSGPTNSRGVAVETKWSVAVTSNASPRDVVALVQVVDANGNSTPEASVALA